MGETLEQVVQRSCGCPVTGSVPRQVGMGLWATWFSERCPCLRQKVGLDGLWMSLPTQTIPWFYDCS